MVQIRIPPFVHTIFCFTITMLSCEDCSFFYSQRKISPAIFQNVSKKCFRKESIQFKSAVLSFFQKRQMPSRLHVADWLASRLIHKCNVTAYKQPQLRTLKIFQKPILDFLKRLYIFRIFFPHYIFAIYCNFAVFRHTCFCFPKNIPFPTQINRVNLF